ncbi:MAG: hypothetical protein IJG50_05655 [Clostridia bacterium]|nr:hypothetical protein [Clostridia bacterium]
MKKRLTVFIIAALIICLLVGCASGGKPDEGEQAGTAETVETDDNESLTAQEFFWLAAEYRFDCVPFFDEGRTPQKSSDHLMYAFIMNEQELKANMDGYVQMPAALVDETAEEYFNATHIIHASDEGMWDYDEETETYTATGWGYANEPSYIMEDCQTEDTPLGRVYTVLCRPLDADEFNGMELSPYFVIDFTENDYDSEGLRRLNALIRDSGLYSEGMTYGEAITALMDAGRTAEIPVSADIITFRFYLKDGHPVFLEHTKFDAARFFEFAVDYRLDYLPFFDEGSAPKRAGEYLMYTFILNEKKLKDKAEDRVKMPSSLVDETAKKHFDEAGLSHESFENLWEYDPDGEEYTATGWGYANERIYVMRAFDTEVRDGRIVYTVWAAPADIEEFDVMIKTDTPVSMTDDHGDWPPSENLRALDELIRESGIYEEGMTYREAIAELLRRGYADEIPLAYEKDKFVFYFDGGEPVFLAHYADYSD